MPAQMKELIIDEDMTNEESDLPFLFLNQHSWLEKSAEKN